jgi:pimeloyl-ACP methyl ester carboxylesterase
MPTASVNGVRLFYEISGNGEIPLVFVHGSWASYHIWDFVVPRLAESFRVLAYDRRGHSESQCPSGQGSVQEDVADLAVLIEHLKLGPAWVAGNSFGASITLLTMGDQSPPTFAPVVRRLAEVLPNVDIVTFPGAAHVAQVTHPDAYVETIIGFISKNSR